mmetsp:Transcript_119043/g.265708  ORF Transcript_119043/g.265708 Transcript_119043/m.265708 type:complete len:275 (-) Transcript_119043:96-920(-)
MAGVNKVLLLLSLSCMSSASLLQAVTLHRASDSCECLGWQDAYKAHGADCSSMGDETCTKFFMNLPNEKVCLNEDFGKTNPKQWCYVSSSCQSGQALTWDRAFRFGQKRTDQAKFKWCGEDDTKLADKTPSELKEWTTANDLEIGLAVHFSYPTWQPEKLTTDVLSFFGVEPPADAPREEFRAAPLTPELRERLQKQADTGKATLILSTAGHPPFGIMKGKELYWLNFSDEQLALLTSGQDFFAHKGTMNNVKCVAGCDEVVATWMSPINAMIR